MAALERKWGGVCVAPATWLPKGFEELMAAGVNGVVHDALQLELVVGGYGVKLLCTNQFT
jgi:hypothetical protein